MNTVDWQLTDFFPRTTPEERAGNTEQTRYPHANPCQEHALAWRRFGDLEELLNTQT
jgi:hypothetical protein